MMACDANGQNIHWILSKPRVHLFIQTKMYLMGLIWLASLAGQLLCEGVQKPTIYDLQFGNRLAENQRFFLTCLAPSAGQDAAFEWFLNGHRLVPNENVYVKQDEESSMLNIRSMSLELAGEYECRVTNRFGKDSRSVSVKLEGEHNKRYE